MIALKPQLIFAICLFYSYTIFGQNDIDKINLTNPDGLGDMQMVFEPGLRIHNEEVCKTFQPSCVITSKGTLLVFCQGRLYSGADNDPKIILMNKSYDMGLTWEGVEVLSSPMNFFAISPYVAVINGKERVSFLTCVGLKVTKKYYDHDPELLREKTGIDLVEFGNDNAAVLCRYYSDDDGITWEMETLVNDKTPLYKNYNGFTPVFMNTIGQVHHITEGVFRGRLILAAPMYTASESDTITDNFRNHICSGSGLIYSDDKGETWKMDGMINDFLGNEASAVSIDNGKAILMIRRLNNPSGYEEFVSNSISLPGINERIAHKSYDGGKTWTEPFFLNISDIKCHGTLARVNQRLYFSIPAGMEDKDLPKKRWDDDRVHGAIYYSDDDGKSWNYKIIEQEYFSYSTVSKLNGDYMITFFSRGGHGRFGIGYRVFTDQWLDR